MSPVVEPDPGPPLRIEGGPLPYLLSVPPHPLERPAPVLCFLHGYDEAAPLDLEVALTRHGPLRPGSSPRAVRDFVVVAPQLPRAGDVWSRFAEEVREVVVDAVARAGGDPRRWCLTGFSFGGNGVFDLALAQPEHWCALWAVDPTRVPLASPPAPVWLTIGAVARRRADGFIGALGLRPPGPEPLGDRIYLDEGDDHVGSARRAYADDRIYSWLLARAAG